MLAPSLSFWLISGLLSLSTDCFTAARYQLVSIDAALSLSLPYRRLICLHCNVCSFCAAAAIFFNIDNTFHFPPSLPPPTPFYLPRRWCADLDRCGWLAGWLAGTLFWLVWHKSPLRIDCFAVLSFCFCCCRFLLPLLPPTSSSFSLSLLFISRVSLLFWLLFSASARRGKPLLIIESFNLIEWCGCFLGCAMHLHCYLCCELVSQGEDWRLKKKKKLVNFRRLLFWRRKKSGLCLSVCICDWFARRDHYLIAHTGSLRFTRFSLWLWAIFLPESGHLPFLFSFFFAVELSWVEVFLWGKFLQPISRFSVFCFLLWIIVCVFLLLSVSVLLSNLLRPSFSLCTFCLFAVVVCVFVVLCILSMAHACYFSLFSVLRPDSVDLMIYWLITVITLAHLRKLIFYFCFVVQICSVQRFSGGEIGFGNWCWCSSFPLFLKMKVSFFTFFC